MDTVEYQLEIRTVDGNSYFFSPVSEAIVDSVNSSFKISTELGTIQLVILGKTYVFSKRHIILLKVREV